MERKLVSFIMVLLVLVVVPYVVYTIYINHQDDLITSLTEFDSFTTVDKEYDVKVMKYNGVSGGEEVYTLKFYLVNKQTEEAVFIKNVRISAYGTKITFTDDKQQLSHDIKVLVTASSSKGESFTIDCLEMREKGQKIRAVF